MGRGHQYAAVIELRLIHHKAAWRIPSANVSINESKYQWQSVGKWWLILPQSVVWRVVNGHGAKAWCWKLHLTLADAASDFDLQQVMPHRVRLADRAAVAVTVHTSSPRPRFRPIRLAICDKVSGELSGRRCSEDDFPAQESQCSLLRIGCATLASIHHVCTVSACRYRNVRLTSGVSDMYMAVPTRENSPNLVRQPHPERRRDSEESSRNMASRIMAHT
jgi:hypothetical protein